MKAVLAISALFLVASLAAYGVQPGAQKGLSQTPIMNQEEINSQQTSSQIDDLLKYQRFLREESDEEHADLDHFIAYISILATVVGFFIGYIGFKTKKDLLLEAKTEMRAIKSEAELKIEELFGEIQRTSRARFEARFTQLEKTYERRQMKYYMLLVSYFCKLIEVTPNLCQSWMGIAFKNHHFRGKCILWVDDDCGGIAMFVALLKMNGIESATCTSTEEALDQPLANFHLIVSNLRRGAEDNAGLLMTQRIRREKQSRVPIIIFTHKEHIVEYGEDLITAGVSAIATNEPGLFLAIAQQLDKNATSLEA